MEPVLSISRDDFDQIYEKLDEIGRGGFSTVHKCVNKITREIYAVKVIDLRPLRFREKFNPTRLRREVDIMRRLKHPNIIQFVDVFETPEYLMVVMEYAPGRELFDVILERKSFTEQDARPIFQQVASALNHLHSLDIIHRDIKPENILILNTPDPVTGLPIAKLLDFGLSKHAGLGSAAKTFVGTPCYLAPEVEFTAKGLGGTYSSLVDCWSLGAVLYVMLVARFPEFDHQGERLLLKLPPTLWHDKSSAAKDLLKRLMCYDPEQRLSAAEALRHEWLAEYRWVDVEMAGPGPNSERDDGMLLSRKQSCDESIGHKSSSSDAEYQNSTISLRPGFLFPTHQSTYQSNITYHDGVNQEHSNEQRTVGYSNMITYDMHLPLLPLLQLQRNIVGCFTQAEQHYSNSPEISRHIREAASMCRKEIGESTKMLRKIEQTSAQVLQIFFDLELAVEQGEPQLAIALFGTVKSWITELIKLVSETQHSNQKSIDQLQLLLNVSSRQHHHELNSITLSTLGSAAATTGAASVSMNDVRDAIRQLQEKSSAQSLSSQDILELFSNLFGQDQWRERGVIQSSPRGVGGGTGGAGEGGGSAAGGGAGGGSQPGMSESSGQSISDPDEVIIDSDGTARKHQKSSTQQQPPSSKPTPQQQCGVPPHGNDYDGAMEIPAGEVEDTAMVTSKYHLSSNGHADQMENVLELLRKVNFILEQLSLFWSNTEIVLDLLSKKGQHAEQFVGFARNPKLLSRFKERLSEYRRFWEGVMSMCHTYFVGMTNPEETLVRFSSPEEVFSSSSSLNSTPTPVVS